MLGEVMARDAFLDVLSDTVDQVRILKLRANVRWSSWPHWKARSEYRFEIGHFAPTGAG